MHELSKFVDAGYIHIDIYARIWYICLYGIYVYIYIYAHTYAYIHIDIS